MSVSLVSMGLTYPFAFPPTSDKIAACWGEKASFAFKIATKLALNRMYGVQRGVSMACAFPKRVILPQFHISA